MDYKGFRDLRVITGSKIQDSSCDGNRAIIRITGSYWRDKRHGVRYTIWTGDKQPVQLIHGRQVKEIRRQLELDWAVEEQDTVSTIPSQKDHSRAGGRFSNEVPDIKG